ncbi:MAG: L,D-transpeptidase family protein [Bacteroides sp.]|jgi:hypothetical protein|nr:L,D-transpeptidase family protein [Bacteroides sp.]
MPRFLKLVLIVTFTAVVILLAAWLVWRSWPVYPEQRMAEARAAISQARNVKAGLYAPSAFGKAEACYDSAVSHLAMQKQEWFLSRDYAIADSFAMISISEANRAADNALVNRKHINASTSKRMEVIQSRYQHLDWLIGWLPLSWITVKQFTGGKISLSKAAVSNENGNLPLVNDLLDDALKKVQIVEKHVNEVLNGYFKDYPGWVTSQKEAIAWTRHNESIALLVDKFERKCHVIQNGKMIRSFDIELGKNWIGDKTRKGDKSTPEGQYKVVQKKKNKETKYHKALLLDYPNEDDKRRFEELKSSGHIPSDAQIGGLIEIHGAGGRGIDWTDGCIALSNSDMDQLYNMVKTYTPVIIVGSIKPLEEILSQHEKDVR